MSYWSKACVPTSEPQYFNNRGLCHSANLDTLETALGFPQVSLTCVNACSFGLKCGGRQGNPVDGPEAPDLYPPEEGCTVTP